MLSAHGEWSSDVLYLLARIIRNKRVKTEIPKLVMSSPATYRICVQGHLDVKWSDYVQGMSIATEYDECQNPITSLTGQLLDQTALTGVINALYDHHLPLLSVECLLIDSISQEG